MHLIEKSKRKMKYDLDTLRRCPSSGELHRWPSATGTKKHYHGHDLSSILQPIWRKIEICCLQTHWHYNWGPAGCQIRYPIIQFDKWSRARAVWKQSDEVTKGRRQIDDVSSVRNRQRIPQPTLAINKTCASINGVGKVNCDSLALTPSDAELTPIDPWRSAVLVLELNYCYASTAVRMIVT